MLFVTGLTASIKLVYFLFTVLVAFKPVDSIEVKILTEKWNETSKLSKKQI